MVVGPLLRIDTRIAPFYLSTWLFLLEWYVGGGFRLYVDMATSAFCNIRTRKMQFPGGSTPMSNVPLAAWVRKDIHNEQVKLARSSADQEKVAPGEEAKPSAIIKLPGSNFMEGAMQL